MDKARLRRQLEHIEHFIMVATRNIVREEEIIADKIAMGLDTTLSRSLLANMTKSLNLLQENRDVILALLKQE